MAMRERSQVQALGDLHGRIKQARVLMVGAGGIGCELLKNLVCTGFGEVHIVDLDTIDLSNLNRQFLFRHEHIKKSKALVARDSATRFNPDVKITAHHANIKDPSFNLSWFSSFTLVFNALDNLDARRHVNRMCLAAYVPLIESGTTGFAGQVQVIKRGASECYDCNPKETPKTFPVCTIRSTPSQPIHCIVWAKSYLFAEIFGVSEDDSPDLDTTEDADNAEEMEKLRDEAHALKRIREAMGSEDFPRRVFGKVFNQDILRLREMKDMWKSRGKPPDPLDFDKLTGEALGVGAEIDKKDQTVWTPAENFAVFSTSLRRLSDRLEELRSRADVGNAAPVLTFDKDDKDILDFVASSANLRSLIFNIKPKTEFDIKEMAGNIIPAIATTNAMTASLCVLQSFKVLRSDYRTARMLFLTRSTERLIASEPLRPPKPDCPVCSVARARISIDPARATLSDLVEGVLRKQVGYGEEFSVSSERGILFDPDLEDNLPKKLSEIGVVEGGFLTVIDEAEEEPRVNLVLAIEGRSDSDAPVVLAEKVDIPRRPKPAPEIANGTNGAPRNGMPNGVAVAGEKRKRAVDEADVEAEVVRKRGKVMEENGDGPGNGEGERKDQAIDVEIADGDGAIVIGDD